MESIDGDGTYMYNPMEVDAVKEGMVKSEQVTMTEQDSVACEEDESDKRSSNSSESATLSEAIEETQLEETQPIEIIKKNLAEEEEFRLVDHKEPIHIFLKVKPLSALETNKQKEKLYEYHEETGVSVRPPKSSCYAQKKQTLQSLSQTVFQFSYVFKPTISQKDFFKGTLYPCFESFFKGDNLLIFSYGVTNSGKTYTMQGTNTDPGLIPRTLDFLFDTLKLSQSNETVENKSDFNIYRYKPDKFNEIAMLNETEYNNEMTHKNKIINLSKGGKGLERAESFQSLNDKDTPVLDAASLNLSKKFGSLDSLSTVGNSELDNTLALGNTTSSSLPKISLPSNKQYAMWISFYEVYNDSVYDLLTLKSAKVNFRNVPLGGDRPQLKVREDSNKVPYVEGLTYIPIANTKEAIRILKYGEKNLQKSSNSINMNSSRSHAVFCLKVVSLEEQDNDNKNCIASINQLSFCDLAGLERSKQTEATGKTAKEASNINQSLLSLSRCINTMITNQKPNQQKEQIPYRINKLTRLFQAYFEGRGMVKMIVNFNPSLSCFDESVGVLKFAAIANQIQIRIEEEKFKHQYKINTKSNESKNRLTVGWESGADEEEESEEDEEDEDETTELETDSDSNDESGSELETDQTMEVGDSDAVESGEEAESGEEEDSSEEDGSTAEEESGEEENGETSDDGSEESSSGDEDDEEDEEETDSDEEESSEENCDQTSGNLTQSVIEKKTIKFSEDHSINRTCDSTRNTTLKSAIRKTPAVKKNVSLLDKSKQFKANESLANRRKSIIETEMTREQLVAKVYSLKKENDQIKLDRIKSETELRSELVSKWSKREEETENYYQEEIKVQRKKVEDCYLKRMEMLEKLMEQKCEKRLDELRQLKEDELEKQREQIISYSLNLRKVTEECEEIKEKLKKLQIEQGAMESFHHVTINKLETSVDVMSSTTIGHTKATKPTDIFDKNHISLIKEERMSQSRFEKSLKLEIDEDEDEETEYETTNNETTQYETTQNETTQNETTQNETTQNETTQNETTQYETTQNETTQNETCEQSTCVDEDMETEEEDSEEEEGSEEDESSSSTSCDGSGEESVEESINVTVDNTTVNMGQTRAVVLVNCEIQTDQVLVNSAEAQVDLMGDELKLMAEKLQLKIEECDLINSKFVEKVALIENMTSDINNLHNDHSKSIEELNQEKIKLTQELEETQQRFKNTSIMLNTLKNNHKMANERYENLEKEHRQLISETDSHKSAFEEAESKLLESEKLVQNFKQDLVTAEENITKLKAQLSEKTVEVSELETDVKEHGQIIENKNKEIENLENDIQFNINQIEKLEFKLDSLERSKMEVEKKLQSDLKSLDKQRLELMREVERADLKVEEALKKACVEENMLRQEIVKKDNLLTVKLEQIERVEVEKDELTKAMQAQNVDSETKKTVNKKRPIETDEYTIESKPNKKRSVEIDSNVDVSFETLERIKALDKHEDMAVTAKPPARSSKSSLKSESSKTSLKKSARSSSMLNSSKLNTIDESEAVKKVSKKKSITKKALSIEDNEQSDVKEEVKKSKKKTSVKSSSRKVSTDLVAENDDLMEMDQKPAKTNLKKKSTLNRITDLIAKSPILEPLRNRPKRGGTSRNNDTGNASTLSNLSMNNTKNVLGEKSNTLPAAKKATKKASKANLMDDLNKAAQEENENTENTEVVEAPRKTSRKKTTKA